MMPSVVRATGSVWGDGIVIVSVPIMRSLGPRMTVCPP